MGGKGAVASPMLKKMALVILPNSMRKRGYVEELGKELDGAGDVLNA